ncbi:MAG TPA: hypothetical protein VIK86_04225 [Candidatus Paceibacterota bacterium]
MEDREDSIKAIGLFVEANNLANGEFQDLSIIVLNAITNNIELKHDVSCAFTTKNYDGEYSDNRLNLVNIVWEDSGIKKYLKLGLFGFYSAYYVEMEYDVAENCLILDTTDTSKVIRIYGM